MSNYKPKNIWTYKINGKEICGFPSSLEKLANVEVEYEVFDGWMMPTTDIRDFKSLPTNAKIYLKRIEELLGIPIKYIGVGAERDAMIHIEWLYWGCYVVGCFRM